MWLKEFIVLSIYSVGATCENIIEGRPSGNAACGGDLQWRKFHPLVLGRPCRGRWNNFTERMSPGTFDYDYNCHFTHWERGGEMHSTQLPTEMGKYGTFEILIQTKLCNLAWVKSNHDFPSNAIIAEGGDRIYVARKSIDQASYRYGKIWSHIPSSAYYPSKDLQFSETSDFDILVCND